MTQKKSKKRSASNNAAPPDAPTLFIDVCAWSHKLGDALTALGAPYIPLTRHFPANTPDEIWLEEIGKRGWILLTRDERIRRRPNELQAFREHGVIGFVLTAGNASAADTAELITRVYSKLIRKAKAAKPPALFTIHISGTFSQIKL